MHIALRGVNDAFEHFVSGIFNGKICVNTLPSRNGEVLRIEQPVICTYEQPLERVLFNTARDCNPFFHLYEALWMLAGRNDVQSLTFYNSRMADFSDDGYTLNGAYGHRWRSHFGCDQIKLAIYELKANPYSRRVVIGMFDPGKDGPYGRMGGKDVPCNTQIYLEVEDEKYVNMTVTNRSNDLVWGMLGANMVHMSYLQQYIAEALQLQVGTYNQITNNLHVYTDNWEPEKWLSTGATDKRKHLTCDVPLIEDGKFVEFDRELGLFVSNYSSMASKEGDKYKSKYLEWVAKPMMLAFKHHKNRNYTAAEEAVNECQDEDWKRAGLEWLNKRRYNWEKTL